MSEDISGQDTGSVQTPVADTPAAITPVPAQASEGQAAPQGEAPANPEEQSGTDKPKDGRLQVRFSELTGQRDAAVNKATEAAREAEYWRQQALAAAQPQARPNATADTGGAPDPSQYDYGDTDPRYIQDLVDFRVKDAVGKTLEQRETEQRNSQVQREQTERIDTLRTKLFESGLSGAQLLASGGDVPCTPSMIDAMAVSDNPAQVADFLGNNRAEAARIAGLAPVQQGFELARIATRLANPQVQPTNAPAQTPTVNGITPASDSFSPTMSQADFEASIERQHGGFYGRQ